jgi:hypothetical protein
MHWSGFGSEKGIRRVYGACTSTDPVFAEALSPREHTMSQFAETGWLGVAVTRTHISSGASTVAVASVTAKSPLDVALPTTSPWSGVARGGLDFGFGLGLEVRAGLGHPIPKG